MARCTAFERTDTRAGPHRLSQRRLHAAPHGLDLGPLGLRVYVADWRAWPPRARRAMTASAASPKLAIALPNHPDRVKLGRR
jgi:hypothetical protein